MIKYRFGKRLAILTIPVGKEHDFKGVISVLDQKMFIWDKDELVEYSVSDIPEEHKDRETIPIPAYRRNCREDEAPGEIFE